MSKILIIEDDVFLAKMYSLKLNQEGFETFILNDGKGVLDYLSNNHVDLILSDIIMPGKNGFDVLKELRSNDSTKNIPVIVLSKLSSDSDINKALKLGANEFANKMDFSFEEIITKVKTYLPQPNHE